MLNRRNDLLAAEIDKNGFCILRDLVPGDVIEALLLDLEPSLSRTAFCKGDFYGHQTKRLGGLARRSDAAQRLILQPEITRLARAILEPACDRIQLNVAQAIEIHPGEVEQFPHRDHDMWPVEKAGEEFLLNVIWPLDPFTSKNGATQIYPGSHRGSFDSLDELGDPLIAECNPGSAICFLGSTVHGAGANRSTKVRRAVVIGYSLGWLKPHENPWLAYPPEVARTFPRELRDLIGYIQHRPNLGNFEGQCPSVLLDDSLGPMTGATDALLPEQAEMVGAFARERRLQR